MLEWNIEPAADDAAATRVRLRGAITERTDFDAITVDVEHLVLVADGIRYINSTGLKRLWTFLGPVAERCAIEIERCSPALITQLNLMPALAAAVAVRSVIVPLECSECVAEADILLPIAADRSPPPVPTRPCEVCGAAMELAEVEARYFSFLG